LNGGEKIIPIYKQQTNDPFSSNVHKEIKTEKYKEKEKMREKTKSNTQTQKVGSNTELDQLVNLQVYQQPQKQKKSDQTPNILPIMTASPFIPQQMISQYENYPYSYLPPPILQKYNINISGPTANHTQLHTIFEDILPKSQFSNSFTNLSNRISICDFIRATLVKNNDGEDIGVEDNGTHSLLYYMKFMEINPYNNNKYTENPYIGLPNGLLIYRTCYPVRYDSQIGYAKCAKNALGIIVKIYNISRQETSRSIKLIDVEPNALMTNKRQIKMIDNSQFNNMSMDEWRDLEYYKFIRDNIIKKKVCPNFVSLYAYFINTSGKIDFRKVAMIKKQNLNVSGIVLIVLTEAPTYSIFGWTTKMYSKDGNKMSMVQTGFHNDKIWFSVIFQLMVAIYVLQINGIYIHNISLHDVFIKDLNLQGPVTHYWKYKINGIDYYIPNYGYLVLIDSTFKDKTDNLYKIDFNVDFDKCFDMFNNIFYPGSFTQGFVTEKSIQPPEVILQLISKIHDYSVASKSKNIDEYLFKFMSIFLNNRIGTYLKESELRNIREINCNEFIKGQIVVYEFNYRVYKFVLYLGIYDEKIKIVTRDEVNGKIQDDYVMVNVAFGSIHNYSMVEPITQKFTQGLANMNESDLLETYVIDMENNNLG